MPLVNSSHRRLLASSLGVVVLAAYGCGGSDTASYGGGAGYSQPADPAAVLEEQRKTAEALSKSSQAAHEAQMNAINSMAP